MILWRPVGVRELELIAASQFRAFPPRLPHQPIFYPVLTREYATAIARDWNTQDAVSGFAGFVTRFELDDRVALRYSVHAAGATEHRELWIPAADLPAINASLRGPIRVEAGFAGAKFSGRINATTHLPVALEAEQHAWSVWRRDDHGNESPMSHGHTRSEAEAIVATFEARGHKQSYWVRRDDDRPDS